MKYEGGNKEKAFTNNKEQMTDSISVGDVIGYHLRPKSENTRRNSAI